PRARDPDGRDRRSVGRVRRVGACRDVSASASCVEGGTGRTVARVTVRLALVLSAAALLVLALALQQRRHSASGAVLPRVPGVLDPDVTQATIHSTICVRGWTSTIRPPVEYTNELKLRQMRA